jgi:hypothetical protein
MIPSGEFFAHLAQSGSGRRTVRGGAPPSRALGYSRFSSSPSSSSAIASQVVRPATAGPAQAIRYGRLATADGATQLATAAHSAHQVQAQQISKSLIFLTLSLSCAIPSLWKKGRRVAVDKACVESPRAVTALVPEHAGQRSGHGGQHSARPPNCPSSDRNGVPHAAGTVSAITPESCPSWAGARSPAPEHGTPTRFSVHQGAPA